MAKTKLENISIDINTESIEKTIEKVNQLIQLLREAQTLIDSLSKSKT